MPQQQQKTALQDYQERIARLEERCKDVEKRYELPFNSECDKYYERKFPYIQIDQFFDKCIFARLSPDVVLETYARAFVEERDTIKKEMDATGFYSEDIRRDEANRNAHAKRHEIFSAAIYSLLKSSNL